MSSEPMQGSTQDKPAARVGCVSRVLYILIVAVVILSFAAGSIYLLWVQPLTREKASLAGKLEAAVAELEDLRPLVAENEQLQGEAKQAALQLLVLTALVDVNAARVNMAQGDSEAAAATLVSIERGLSALQSRLTGEEARAVGQMRDRLDLVRGEIGSDAFAAERDLEVLANDLAQLAEGLQAP
jgi:hypothetical protein